MNEELVVTVRLDSSELHLLKSSIESVEKFYRENPTDKPDWNKERLKDANSILGQIGEVLAPVPVYFGGAHLNFSMMEIALIDYALTKTGGDLFFVIANKEHRNVAERESFNRKYFDYAQDISRLSRTIETARRLAMLEHQEEHLISQQ